MPNRNDVMFVATYHDGSEEYFGIPPDKLRGGDQFAKTFAQEQQRNGWLPEGQIISVQRKTDQWPSLK